MIAIGWTLLAGVWACCGLIAADTDEVDDLYILLAFVAGPVALGILTLRGVLYPAKRCPTRRMREEER